MKTTWYFDNRVLVRRPDLRIDWIQKVLANPIRVQIQGDGRIRHWGFHMEIIYDASSDMLYIGLFKLPSSESEEVAPGIVLDYDENNRVVGIEIDGGARLSDLSRLDVSGFSLSDLAITGQVGKEGEVTG